MPSSVVATTVVPPTFAELVNESDYIVRTRVKSLSTEWREIKGNRCIFTRVEMELLEVVHGSPPQPLVLEMLGGKIGNEEMIVQGMPRFALGEEDILFVRGNTRSFYPLTAAMHGRYSVVRESNGPAHINRSNHLPLKTTAEVSLPLGDGSPKKSTPTIQQSSIQGPALTPDEFTREIRAAVDKNYRRRTP